MTIVHHRGNKQETKGRAYIVYEDIYDAKNAVDHLSGFNVRDRYSKSDRGCCAISFARRYIIVLYHKQHREEAATDLQKKQEDLNRLKAQHGVDDLD